MPVIDEYRLVENARQGDVNAFRQLVELYKVKIYRLAYDLTGNGMDAEDLSQDVFIKAYRSLEKFRGESKFGTWLYRITINTCLDHKSKKSLSMVTPLSTSQQEDESLPPEPAGSEILPDRVAESSLIQNNIERALEQLTPREKTVFMLRHYHDLPLKDIAETLNISSGSVKTLLFRAIRRLQDELSMYSEEYGTK